MSSHRFLTSLMVAVAMGSVHADNIIHIEDPDLSHIQIGDLVHAGSGCLSGTISTDVDATTGELNVTFDDYVVIAGGSHRLDRANCALTIPIKVDKGVKVAIVASEYSGYNILPEGAVSTFTAETFLAGSQGTQVSEVFSGELESGFLVQDAAILKEELAGGCGADLNLRINTSLRVRTNSYREIAVASVEGMNTKGGALKYKLKLKKCE